jgi:hypothetical protein
LDRYRSIDQGEFDTAYQQINNPQMSFEEFVVQWEKYSLVSVEAISTPTIFFKQYGGSKVPYLAGLGNFNQFSITLFSKDAEGNISYLSQALQVIDGNAIQITENNARVFGMYENLHKKELFTKLYYHLIATHRFQQAYEMQYSHSQSLDLFAKTYEDTLGVVFKEYEEMYCNTDGSCSSSSADDPNE